MKTNFSLSIACGAMIAALSLAASAQDAPKKVLTRDEYRACRDNQDALKARADAIKARGAKAQEEGDAIKAEHDQLVEEEKRVQDSSFSGARDRFERKTKQHNLRAKAAEESGKALQADADTFTKDLDAHNAKCSNVAINKEDREAVDKEREVAGKK